MLLSAFHAQVPEIAQYAVSSLQAVASRAGPFGLTDSAKALLSSLPAWPQALLSVLPTLASSIPLSLLIDVWHRSVASTAAAAELAPAGAAEPSAGAEDGGRTPDLKFGSQAPKAAEEVEGLLQSQHGSYMQQLLVAELGALGTVWADERQRQVLLGLPLPAMQLLLSCSTLQVCNGCQPGAGGWMQHAGILTVVYAVLGDAAADHSSRTCAM